MEQKNESSEGDMLRDTDFQLWPTDNSVTKTSFNKWLSKALTTIFYKELPTVTRLMPHTNTKINNRAQHFIQTKTQIISRKNIFLHIKK